MDRPILNSLAAWVRGKVWNSGCFGREVFAADLLQGLLELAVVGFYSVGVFLYEGLCFPCPL